MNLVKNWFDKLSSSDNRKAPRAESPLLVAYYWDGAVPMAHKIKNISTTGFYLLTKERWHPGTVITMTLQRSDAIASADHYISVMSKVVRLGQDGVGFIFVPLEARSSGSAKAIPKSKPVGKRALGKFLEQLNLNEGNAVVGFTRGVEEEIPVCLDAGSETPAVGTFARLKDESGQAMILAALCMTCLLGFVALATDVGIMLHEKRLAQIAADSAAVAGSADLSFGTASSAAQAAAAQNGFTNGSNGASVVVNPSPTSGPFSGDARYIEVIISQNQPTLFMALFGRTSMTVTARAVATNGAGSTCMYLLGPTGSDLSLTGSASINVRSCGILDNSVSSNAIALTGSGAVVAQSLGVAATAPGYSITGSGRITPTPTAGIAQASDPLAFLPTPTVAPSTPCAAFTANGSTPVTLTPGCYGGLTINGSGTVTMNPGNYLFNGPVVFNGSGAVTMGSGIYEFNSSLNFTGSENITGTGVTLYVTTAAGSVNLTGSGTMSLSAPTSGTYNGILFFEQRGDTNALTITGSHTTNFSGIFYLPSANVILTGSEAMTYNAAFVVNQLSVTGSQTITLNNFATVNPSTPLTSTRLVE
jgi:Flp pilus assembly protein TadG